MVDKMKSRAITTDEYWGQQEEVAPPRYLADTYWWAYVHPRAVHFFERQWLVNLILWGNFNRLRDVALDAMGPELGGRNLQIACVYGNLTRHLLNRMAPEGSLDIVDILPIQLTNLERKLQSGHGATLIKGDSAALPMESATYDRALLFFLMHEQPAEVRRETLREALRVVKPGGRLVVVDYHRPSLWNPLYWPMKAILHTLEPFALGIWKTGLDEMLPADPDVHVEKKVLFGGLYQLLTFDRKGQSGD